MHRRKAGGKRLGVGRDARRGDRPDRTRVEDKVSPEVRQAVLSSLAERMTKDPRLRALVSAEEIHALETVVAGKPAASTEPAPIGTATRPSPRPVTRPGPRPGRRIILDALDAAPLEDTVLCLDFGTAASKAAVCRGGRDVMPLALAPEEEDLNRFAADSSLFQTGAGALAFGPAARRESAATGRPRIDSLKRVLGRAPLDRALDAQPLGSLGVRGADALSLADALRLFFAWLSRRAERAAVEQHRWSGRLLRRYAVPCWPAARWLALKPQLARLMAEAIVVADSFGGELDAHPPLDELIHFSRQVAGLDRLPVHLVGRAVTEPVAAAAARFGPESATRGLVLVIDVGAGTTDLALFIINADPDRGRFEILPIDGGSDLVSRAGDSLDRALVQLAVNKASAAGGPLTGARLRRRLEPKARAAKETLLRDGVVSVEVGDVRAVNLEASALLTHPDVAGLEALLRARIEQLLGRLPKGRAHDLAPEGLTVCLAGGGAELPMIQALHEGHTAAHGVTFAHRKGPELPPFVLANPRLAPAYPRLAVALGGASGYLPTVTRVGSRRPLNR